MKITTINIGSLPASYGIVLGRRGETEAAQIIFDVSSLVSTYGDGSAVLMVKRPTDTDAYPAVIERVDDTVVWTITTTETEYKGSGKCELFWYIGEALAKSIVFRTVVMEDIGAVVSDPPDPYESWVDSLTALGAEAQEYARQAASSADDAEAAAAQITGMTAEAETLPTGSEATASYEDGVLHFGIPTGPQGEQGDPGQNGVSPTVTVADITGGHRVTITDANGTQTFDVMNGEPGEKGDDGISPVVTVTEITGGHRVSITDASGTQTFDVMDGTGGGGGTSDYNDLSNKPQINGVALSGNKTPAQLGLAAASDIPTVPVQSVNGKTGAVVLNASDVGALPSSTSIPTKTSDLTNDSGYVNASGAASAAPVQSVNGKTGTVALTASDVGAGTYTKPSGGIPKTDFASGVQDSLDAADTAYQKPSGGIPASDLASAVQTSLGKADSALQSVPSTYRTSAAQDTIDATKITAPPSPASGAFLVWDGTAWVAQTLSTWQGGSY